MLASYILNVYLLISIFLLARGSELSFEIPIAYDDSLTFKSELVSSQLGRILGSWYEENKWRIFW